MTSPVPILRPSARALILNSEDRLLLFHAHDLRLDEPDLWFTPGGGLEGDEDYEQALLRELWEETGLELPRVGPWVWSRRTTWRAGDILYDSPERFYLIRVDQLDVRPKHTTPIERDTIVGYHWWSVDEIQAASTTEVFVPRCLGELLVRLLSGNIPKVPIDTGV